MSEDIENFRKFLIQRGIKARLARQPKNEEEAKRLIMKHFPKCPICKSESGYHVTKKKIEVNGIELDFSAGGLLPISWAFFTCNSCGTKWEIEFPIDDFTDLRLVSTAAKGSELRDLPLGIDFWKDFDKNYEKWLKEKDRERQRMEAIVKQDEKEEEWWKKHGGKLLVFLFIVSLFLAIPSVNWLGDVFPAVRFSELHTIIYFVIMTIPWFLLLSMCALIIKVGIVDNIAMKRIEKKFDQEKRRKINYNIVRVLVGLIFLLFITHTYITELYYNAPSSAIITVSSVIFILGSMVLMTGGVFNSITGVLTLVFIAWLVFPEQFQMSTAIMYAGFIWAGLVILLSTAKDTLLMMIGLDGLIRDTVFIIRSEAEKRR